jgi:DNA-directed RNA polymerase subunit RPC12/RpoP
MRDEKAGANVNVTLSDPETAVNALSGRKFPCPTCGQGLPIRIAKTGKPYCVCIYCGNQLFFRGKAGIQRLTQIIESDKLISQREPNSDSAYTLFNRLVQLRLQKDELQQKQGLIRNDQDLTNAIRAVDNEIQRVQRELHKIGSRNRGRGK